MSEAEYLIRFVGKRGEQHFWLKMGPVDVWDPRQRKFQGGDEVVVRILQNKMNPDCVDLTFEDGEFAIEVPREFFEVVAEQELYGKEARPLTTQEAGQLARSRL